ncbi:MAG: HD domain-containing protein [Bacteroidetes bacterium]|nr:MAG: HD domain-containing protein [Bacteroidota bacterium]
MNDKNKIAAEEIPIEKVYALPLEDAQPFGIDKCNDLNILLTNCIKYIENPDIELITRGFYFCFDKHKNVTRESGEPYYTHPLKVALMLIKDFGIRETEATIASLLHDTVEDVEEVTTELIREKFGVEIARIVDGLTKIKGTKTRQMDKTATYSKLFLALVEDVRAIIIKLADRLDNMKTLSSLDEKKRKAIAYETLNFYTPFAQRLGLTKIRRDLEDLSLYFIDPAYFDIIRKSLELKGKQFVDYIRNFLKQITLKLSENRINHIVTIEHKHVYEIYKMIEEGRQLKDIDNFYSIVVTLNTNDYSQCYRTYGIIANVFGPVSSLDDFIARPKINLYRALHSTHLGPGRKLVEVVIRTEEMDKIAVEGIAADFNTLRHRKPLNLEKQDVAEWVKWMQDIIVENDEDAIQKIWGSIRMNLYVDEIVVHIKDGESYILPIGSCPIDLAFAVSDDIAIKCISAKVNGEIKNLDYELSNNDQIELLSSPNTVPSPEWQNYVVTHKAIVKLHQYFKDHPVEIITEPQEEISKYDVKLRITAEDRPQMLHDITKVIGQINIQRINISTENSVFEGIFLLNLPDKTYLDSLFTNLFTVKGIRGIEKLDVVN